MFKRLGIVVICLIAAVHPLEGKAAEPAQAIRDVVISKSFFNPSLGQSMEIGFKTTERGTVSVLVVDRDGFPVRTVVHESLLAGGDHSATWDGRNDAGVLVADEAYSLKIDLSGSSGNATYFPADVQETHSDVMVDYFDRRQGTVVYTLAAPSRVHMQAGTSRKDQEGPVLKTVVNRQPRPAGSVVEHWDGTDEGGTIRVSELPNFVLGAVATPLPENSILTFGNVEQSFVDSVTQRKGRSLLSSSHLHGHAHHTGLTTLDDISPNLQVTPQNATWDEASKSFVAEKHLRLTVTPTGTTASAFLRQPGKLYLFIDGEPIGVIPAKPTPVAIEIPHKTMDQPAVIAVNWVSNYGPVAAKAVRIRFREPKKGQSR